MWLELDALRYQYNIKYFPNSTQLLLWTLLQMWYKYPPDRLTHDTSFFLPAHFNIYFTLAFSSCTSIFYSSFRHSFHPFQCWMLKYFYGLKYFWRDGFVSYFSWALLACVLSGLYCVLCDCIYWHWLQFVMWWFVSREF